MWNAVFDDGRVCISILHPPGTDKFNELVSHLMRWSAYSLSLLVHRIVYQILFILSEPSSAAQLHPISLIDSVHEDADKFDLEK